MKPSRAPHRRRLVSNPSKQKGWAPIYAFLTPRLLFLGLLLLGVALVVATVAFPALSALRQKSIPMGIAAAVIASFWAYICIAKIALPTQRRRAHQRWEVGAQEVCKRECNSLPDRVLGRSLLAEGVAIRQVEIIQLLSERGFDFIEIKPHLQEGKPPQIAAREELGEWGFPGLTSPYVRLRLCHTSDPFCRPELDWEGALKKPPFLPDTCLAAEPVEQASADLMIVLDPPANERLKQYGAIKLVRRQTQEVLAQLSTVETAGQSHFGRGVRLNDPFPEAKRVNYRAPRYMLADLLFSPDADEPNRCAGVLKVKRCTARASLDPVLAQAESLPLIQTVRESQTFLSWQEERSTFSRTLRAEEWSQTVAIARAAESQTTPYGPQLLDLGGRTLIRLQHCWPYAWWEAHAALDGFFIVKTRDWDTSPRNLLVRFRADGEFEWAVAIAPPELQSLGAFYWPQALFVEGGNLIFAARREVQPEDSPPPGTAIRSLRWEILLASLPAMAPYRRNPANGSCAVKDASTPPDPTPTPCAPTASPSALKP